MKIERVILLHSFKDKNYEARAENIAHSRELDGIEFRHAWVIDNDRSSPRLRELDRIATDRNLRARYLQVLEEVVGEEVGPILDQQIREFRPDIVMMHAGVIFDAVPDACITITNDLMQKYPEEKFALAEKEKWLINASGRDYDSSGKPFERHWATKRIKWVKHNFIDDPDVERIIKAIFQPATHASGID